MSLLMLKSVLTTVVLILAAGQAISGLRLRGYLKLLPLPMDPLRSWHRLCGDAALLLTLSVAVICVTNLSYGGYSPRVPVHAYPGTLAVAAMLAKLTISRRARRYLRYSVVMGGVAGFSVLGVFLSSALPYLSMLW